MSGKGKSVYCPDHLTCACSPVMLCHWSLRKCLSRYIGCICIASFVLTAVTPVPVCPIPSKKKDTHVQEYWSLLQPCAHAFVAFSTSDQKQKLSASAITHVLVYAKGWGRKQPNARRRRTSNSFSNLTNASICVSNVYPVLQQWCHDRTVKTADA